MTDRYFNRSEAEKLLPWLRDLLGQVREQKRRADQIDQEMASVASRILLMGGVVLPYRQLAEKKLLKDRSLERIKESIGEIEKAGCVMKDLEQGLVDFPCLIEDREVFLCWKLGEERILYWHGTDEGFAGRKPLDSSPEDKAPPDEFRPN
jgi:hypothetical protein